MPNGPIYPDSRLFTPKKWGWEETIFNGAFCCKMLFIKLGKKTSFHYHENKDIVIYVQSGMIDLIHSNSDDEIKAKKTILNAGDAFRIKPALRHRILAIMDSYLYETSTHDLSEDKIIVLP
jgi:uncharacterized RmlC-like cupin family protein